MMNTIYNYLIDNSFFIKRVLFQGEQDSLVELISVTKEITEKTETNKTVKPEILVSHIRELPFKEAEKLGLSLENNNDFKKYITKEQAEQVCSLVSDEKEFISLINKLLS